MSAGEEIKVAGHNAPPSIPDIVQEHLEEFGFLSLQRRKLLFGEETTLAALERHDRRIEAHRAGLAVAGKDAANLARARLPDATSAWDLMACVRTWIERAEPAVESVLEAIGPADEVSASGWREAFRDLPKDLVLRSIPLAKAASISPVVEGIAFDAFARHALLTSRESFGASHSENRFARRAIARHLPRLSASVGLPPEDLLVELREDGDPVVRRMATWATVLLDPGRGVELLRRFGLKFKDDPFAGLAHSILQPPSEPAALREDSEAPPRPPSLAFLWRQAVQTGRDPLGIRFEVPDGFFQGVLSDESIPGE